MAFNLITPPFPSNVIISGTSLVFTRADDGVVLTAELPTRPIRVGPNGMSERFPIQIKDVSGKIMVIFESSFVMALTNQGKTDSRGIPLTQIACKFLFLGSILTQVPIVNGVFTTTEPQSVADFVTFKDITYSFSGSGLTLMNAAMAVP
jgi:hypothetical protein